MRSSAVDVADLAASDALAPLRQALHDQRDPNCARMTVPMMLASPAFMAQELLAGPDQAPYNGRFMVAKHHLAWDQLVVNHNRLCVLAARDSGKCAVRGSTVLRADGQRVPIEQWKGGRVLAYDPETHRIKPARAPAAQPNGRKRCLRITTRTGRVETVTRNHPLRTLTAWTQAQDLRVGERIAVPRRLAGLGRKPLQDAWLMGALVGNGGMTGSSVTFTSADAAVQRAVARQAKRRGWQARRIDELSVRLGMTQGTRTGSAIHWARAHGMDTRSAEKKVPAAVFTAPDSDILEFLSGYIDTDCYICADACAAEFSSASERLLRDMQHLLTRIGVVSALAPHNVVYDGRPYKAYRLSVHGQSLVVLADKTSPRGKRKKQLQLAAQRQRKRREGGSIDLLPKRVYEWVEHNSGWFRRRGYPGFHRNCALTRSKARALAAAERNPRLARLADAEILWDEIASIEDVGTQETWGLCVPGPANYVGQDIVNHNTFFFNYAYVIWKIITKPNGRGFIFSATQTQAERIMEDIKSEIENNPRLQWLYPKTAARRWSSTYIKTSNGHRIYARGYGTKVRGGHPDWIVNDDVLNDETAYSTTVRLKQIEYYYTAITNMIVPDGQIITVGTPFARDDLYADLGKNKNYVCAKFPAKDKAGVPLWPMRYSKALLSKKLGEIGSIRFAREFMLEPVSDEASLFPNSLFQGHPVEQMTLKLGMGLEYWAPFNLQIYQGIDVAMSTNIGADYFVIYTVGKDRHGNRWLVDIERLHRASFQTQLSAINRCGILWQPNLIVIESNQAQRIFGDEMIRNTDLPIKKFQTTAEKHSLETGVPRLRMLFENRKYRIPRGDKKSIEMTDLFIGEMHNVTFSGGKVVSVGSNDDILMAAYLAEVAISMGGFSFSFGEDDDIDGPDEDAGEDSQGIELDEFGIPQ